MATCKDFLHVRKEGNRKVQRSRKFYNMDVIYVGPRGQMEYAGIIPEGTSYSLTPLTLVILI